MTARATPLEVLRVALRLGLTSFGGPIAHVGYFRREYVQRRGWLDEASYADLVALSQALPGPASSQLGIAIGTGRAGMAGGVAAWLGFTFPSAIALVVFAGITSSVDLSTAGWVRGLKIAAVAVVAQAVWSMARALAPDWRRRAMAMAAAVTAVAWSTSISQVVIIAAGAIVGRLVLEAPPTRSNDPEVSGISRRVGAASLAAYFGLLVGLPLLGLIVRSQALALFDAFYRSGALVFGGGHVILPLLHATVVAPGWVTDSAFLTGYGAAQAVPGPLFTVAAYLGDVMRLPPAGVLGASIALTAIFLPSFLLVWGVLPFWDLLRRSAGIRSALAGANAVVVGVLLAALYSPIWTSAISGPVDVGIAAAALALLVAGKAPPIVVVFVAAAAGQVVG